MDDLTVTHALLARLQHLAAERGMNPTDYAVAQLIGSSTSKVSTWRKGRSRMSEESVVMACELLWPGDDEMRAYWLLRLRAEIAAETGPHELQTAWEWTLDRMAHSARIARKLAKHAAAVALMAGAFSIAPPPPAAADSGTNQYYVKSRGARRGPQRAARRPIVPSQNATAIP